MIEIHHPTEVTLDQEAIAHDPNALEQTIAESPSTEQVSTDSLRIQRPFLNDTADFSHELRFATADLRRIVTVVMIVIVA